MGGWCVCGGGEGEGGCVCCVCGGCVVGVCLCLRFECVGFAFCRWRLGRGHRTRPALRRCSAPRPRTHYEGRDAEAAAGFVDEINLLSRLKGKANIIQLVDAQVFAEEGLVYMVQVRSGRRRGGSAARAGGRECVIWVWCGASAGRRAPGARDKNTHSQTAQPNRHTQFNQSQQTQEYGEIDLARLLAKHEAGRRQAAAAASSTSSSAPPSSTPSTVVDENFIDEVLELDSEVATPAEVGEALDEWLNGQDLWEEVDIRKAKIDVTLET